MTYGSLSINNETKSTFKWNMQELLGHLNKDSLEQTNFTKAETGRDYLDVWTQVYQKTIADLLFDANNLEQLLAIGLQNYHARITTLLNNETLQEKLTKFGLTALDRALINNNIEEIKTLTQDQKDKNIYVLAKQYRFMPLAKHLGNKNFIEKLKAIGSESEDSDRINLTKQLQEIEFKNKDWGSKSFIEKLQEFFGRKSFIEQLEEIRLEIKNPVTDKSCPVRITDLFLNILCVEVKQDVEVMLSSPGTKTLSYVIQDNGGKTWDNNYAWYQHEQMKPLFDVSMMIGTGVNNCYDSSVEYSYQEFDETLRAISPKNDAFVFVYISAHESKGKGKFIETVKDLVQKTSCQEMLIVVDSCYSGQYHTALAETLETKAKAKATARYLITTSSEKEASYTLSVDKLKNLKKCFVSTNVDSKGFIKFYSDYTESTPEISFINAEGKAESKAVKAYYEEHYGESSQPDLNKSSLPLEPIAAVADSADLIANITDTDSASPSELIAATTYSVDMIENITYTNLASPSESIAAVADSADLVPNITDTDSASLLEPIISATYIAEIIGASCTIL